jgi:hypothetical protein
MRLEAGARLEAAAALRNHSVLPARQWLNRRTVNRMWGDADSTARLAHQSAAQCPATGAVGASQLPP